MDSVSNTLRVLVATDCHLGYMEKDEIRRHDSFNAFDEICSIAEQRQVDFLLLGGDLFHENKPSRTTLVRTIEILRRYCLNDRPVQFQVVSDQTINFPNRFGHVNYEDQHYNVGLPIFTIHGNHDDPAGVDNLSAIDILSACNLVNYFGKMVLGGSGVGQITVYPILIQKGTTKVALYGFGNIRDERLNRMFQTPHAIRWIRPETQGDSSVSDWFNIFVLHQNRVKTNPKNAVNEHFLPRFLDFIIWGHEHECLIDPQEVAGMGFHLSQPGSSIATSLIDGEAKPKHVLLLEIKGSQYRPTKIPLNSVRAFEYADVSLQNEPDLDPNDPEAVLDHLSKLAHDLIVRASEKGCKRPELKLPLIRIKVDYTGYSTINPQRFGQKFVGKVANPHDILIFTKSAKKRQSTNEKEQEKELLRPEELNQQNIEALVAESNLKMEILPVNDLDIALHEFVNKDDRQAFYDCVQHNLEETRVKLSEETDVLQIKEEKDLMEKVSQCMQERILKGRSSVKNGPTRNHTISQGSLPLASTKAGFSDDEDADTELRGAAQKSTITSRSAESSRGRRGRVGGRSSGRGRGSSQRNFKQTTLDVSMSTSRSQRAASSAARAAFQPTDQDVEDIGTSSGSEEVMGDAIADSESEPEPTPTKGRKRQTPQRKDRNPPAKRGRKSTSSAVNRTSYIDIADDKDDDDEDQPRPSSAQTQTRRSWGSLRR
ncbi:hypothetical protein KP509_07G079200 [Ceratopteris richardii]|uniref:Double-strand break repair protein n=2 Tax=Ceratopteris richardii TaxID=49495 RepID=A0A8T2UCG7_CERRI|nr:hypothetical protein KP509_07G079200 [Ceratopteris richardii]